MTISLFFRNVYLSNLAICRDGAPPQSAAVRSPSPCRVSAIILSLSAVTRRESSFLQSGRGTESGARHTGRGREGQVLLWIFCGPSSSGTASRSIAAAPAGRVGCFCGSGLGSRSTATAPAGRNERLCRSSSRTTRGTGRDRGQWIKNRPAASRFASAQPFGMFPFVNSLKLSLIISNTSAGGV